MALLMRRSGVWLVACGLVLTACLTQSDPVRVDLPTDDDAAAGGAGGSEPDGEPMCPHVGDALTDVAAFPECSDCAVGGARCVPTFLLPPEALSKFAECGSDKVCVPEIILVSAGRFIPATCRSLFDSEGRCLSQCLPSVAPKADKLPQDSCAASESCVPCFDPFTGDETGACAQSCDPGPAEPAVQVPECCGGLGFCLPAEKLGDKAEKLGQDNCTQHKYAAVCLPKAFLDPAFKPMTCMDGGFIGGGEGVCLPGCLPSVQGLLADLTLDQEGCPADHLCAPCDNPITGKPTGACDL
jgi:hypothetical protein